MTRRSIPFPVDPGRQVDGRDGPEVEGVGALAQLDRRVEAAAGAGAVDIFVIAVAERDPAEDRARILDPVGKAAPGNGQRAEAAVRGADHAARLVDDHIILALNHDRAERRVGADRPAALAVDEADAVAGDAESRRVGHAGRVGVDAVVLRDDDGHRNLPAPNHRSLPAFLGKYRHRTSFFVTWGASCRGMAGAAAIRAERVRDAVTI